MSIQLGETDTNRYFLSRSELQVNDGDVAYADDVNALTVKVNTAFNNIQAEMNVFTVDASGAVLLAAESASAASGSAAEASGYAVSAYDSSVSAYGSMNTAISAATSAATEVSGTILTASGISGITVDDSDPRNLIIKTSGVPQSVSAGSGLTASIASATGLLSIDTSGFPLTLSGTSGVTVSANANRDYLVYHTDTSPQTSINNAGATFIQDLSFDTYGHVTGAASITITPTIINAASSTHTHEYLPLSGGTMTGNIIMGTLPIRYDADYPYMVQSLTAFAWYYNASDYVTFDGDNGNITLVTNVAGDHYIQIATSGGFKTRLGWDGSNASYLKSSVSSCNFYLSTSVLALELWRDGTNTALICPDITRTTLLGHSEDPWDFIYSSNVLQVSDEKEKNISPIGDVSWLYTITPISYTWKNSKKGSNVKYGFTAQELEIKTPNGASGLVYKKEKSKGTSGGSKEYAYGVDMISLIAPIIQVLKEQKDLIDALTLRVNALEGN